MLISFPLLFFLPSFVFKPQWSYACWSGWKNNHFKWHCRLRVLVAILHACNSIYILNSSQMKSKEDWVFKFAQWPSSDWISASKDKTPDLARLPLFAGAGDVWDKLGALRTESWYDGTNHKQQCSRLNNLSEKTASRVLPLYGNCWNRTFCFWAALWDPKWMQLWIHAVFWGSLSLVSSSARTEAALPDLIWKDIDCQGRKELKTPQQCGPLK